MKFLTTSVLMAAVAISTSVRSADKLSDYDWPSYANDLGSSKYAPLDQINSNSINKLRVAWVWDSPDNPQVEKNRQLSPQGYKSTPIKIGDSLYINTSLGRVVALDAKTGVERWVFDTETYNSGRPANLGFNTRGVAYWANDGKRRILVATNNGYLWSIDADTAIPDKAFGDSGSLDLTQGLGRDVIRSNYSVVSPPIVVGNTVIVGSVVFDMPVYTLVNKKQSDLAPGHVRGFNIATGNQDWIFHSIPQKGEHGNETWEQGSWKVTGGANVWTLMSADLELGYVYLPFGTPSNDWFGGHRLGDNLYAESLVCLDAKTGKRVWHFQMTHHGLWDYDLPAAPNLVDITVNGKDIKAVAQISKQGFVYVFDRVTGEPVWPIEERSVPQSTVLGERTAPTQPFPTKPAPFDLQGISDATLIDFTPQLRKEALEIVSQYDHGPLYTPPSLKGTIQLPGDGGGGEWTGAAFDPDTSLFYLPSVTRPIIVQLIEPLPGTTEYKFVRGGQSNIRGPQRLPLTKPPYGRISAIDLNSGEYEWIVANSEGIRQRIIDMGIPDPGPVGQITFLSPLLTKSLLFVALYDGKSVLRALDKKTGATIHELELPGPPSGAPMTYMIDGKQYISLALGSASDSKLVGLALY